MKGETAHSPCGPFVNQISPEGEAFQSFREEGGGEPQSENAVRHGSKPSAVLTT